MNRFPSWRLANGDRIPIATMTDQHLINAIRLLERQAEREAEIIPFPDFQGEMAQWQAEKAWYDVQVAEYQRGPDHPGYRYLVREARRGELTW